MVSRSSGCEFICLWIEFEGQAYLLASLEDLWDHFRFEIQVFLKIFLKTPATLGFKGKGDN